MADPATDDEAMYYSGVTKMVTAVSSGDPRLMEEAAAEIEAAAAGGYPHAQSALGFLYNMGVTRERNGAKAFMSITLRLIEAICNRRWLSLIPILAKICMIKLSSYMLNWRR